MVISDKEAVEEASVSTIVPIIELFNQELGNHDDEFVINNKLPAALALAPPIPAQNIVGVKSQPVILCI